MPQFLYRRNNFCIDGTINISHYIFKGDIPLEVVPDPDPVVARHLEMLQDYMDNNPDVELDGIFEEGHQGGQDAEPDRGLHQGGQDAEPDRGLHQGGQDAEPDHAQDAEPDHVQDADGGFPNEEQFDLHLEGKN